MDNYKRIDEVRSEWFKNHGAFYEKLSDHTSVLTFKQPKTSRYAIRYILDNNYLIITGDIGEAIFCLTEEADLKKLFDYDMDYLFGKLRTGNSAYDFDADKALSELKNHFYKYTFKTAKEEIEFDELTDQIFAFVKDECNSLGQWRDKVLMEYFDTISKYDQDCYEWLFDIGKEYSWQAIGWIVGLKMAYQILKKEQVI